jgi:methionine--tRNA ligase beta chain
LEKKLKKTKVKSKKVKKKAQKMVDSEIIPLKDFQRLDIRIGTIIDSERVAKTKNLLKLRVDLGEDLGERQLVAGLASFRESEVLVGLKVTVIVNLEPATIRGIRSEGMILAAVEGEELGLLVPDQDVPNGSKVS